MVDTFRAEARAFKIVRNLGLQDPSDISIEDIAWIRGALVVEGGLTGADARLLHTPSASPAIIRVNSTISPRGKKRFAIAHELGHLELAHNPGTPIACTERDFLKWYREQDDQEVEANIFAAELLMPETVFEQRLENTLPSMELIEDLAGQFQTTLTATAIRYAKFCGERCAIVFSHAGKIKWAQKSPDFPYWISRGRKLSSYTCAAEFFAKGTVGQKMENVRLDGWIEHASSREMIKEQARPMPSYNSVLTLLWIP